MVGSSRASSQASPAGVSTGISSVPRSSNARTAFRAPMPAHLPNPSGPAGPKTCRKRRASSRVASAGSISGGGHRPHHGQPRALPPDRERARQGGVAKVVPVHSERPPRRRRTSFEPRRGARAGEAARSSALRRILPPSGSLPSVNTARSRAATTYTWYRGPHTCTSEGSSQADGPVPSTRAWIDRSAARGMLS